MADALDLIGRRFGKLIVVKRLENNNRGNTMWLCRCDCGKEKSALGYDLTHGRTVSCGCWKVGKPSKKRKNLTGQKFGKLTVVSISEEKSVNGILVWKCKCECGNITYVRGGNLKSGHISSCGCSKTEKHSHNYKDLTGMKFGRLTVLKEYGKINSKISWLCLCDCGNEKIVIGDYLKSGRTKSCGCLDIEHRKNVSQNFILAKGSKEKHGMSRSRIYKEYYSMLNRCLPSYHMHKYYYDKGISVCKEWADKEIGFKNFLDWSMKNGYREDLTLDRKDNNKGYYPGNCRWATNKEQQNNKSTNIIIEYMGESKTLKQWCEHLELNYGMILARRRRGWEPPRLFEPPHKNQYQ